MALYDVSIATLVTLVNRYTNRTFTADLDATTGLIPLMVVAKRRMENDLNPSEMEATLDLTGSQLPYTFNDQYKAIKTLIMNDEVQLQPASLQEVRKQQTLNSGSDPKVYNVTNYTLEIGPSPATSDTFELVYHQREQEDYTQAETESVYIKYYMDLWLAAILTEVYLTVQDEGRAKLWEEMYQRRLLEAQRRNFNEEFGGYPLYIRSV